MVKTGGTLKPRLIELIGELNQAETLKNINKDINELEKKLKSGDNKIKLNVELFGNVKEMAKDITEIQSKINSSPTIKDIELGVKLGDVTLGDLKEEIKKLQDKFSGREDTKLKLDVDFDFKGSASKIKEEMEGIRQFMEQYGDQMKNMDLVNLDKDAQNVKKNADGMKTGIQSLGQGIDTVSNEIEADMRKMTNSSGKFGVTFERDVTGAIKGATGTLTSANGTIETFKYNIDSTSGELVHMSTNTKMAGDQQERLEKAIKQTDDAQRKLNQALKTAPDNLPQELAETAQGHINTARAMAEHGQVTEQGMASLTKFDNALAQLNERSKALTIENEFKETQQATREMIAEFDKLGSLAPEDVRRFSDAVENGTDNSTTKLKTLQEEIQETAKEFTQSSSQIEQAMRRMSDASRTEFTNAIKEGDINTVKRYVEELYGAEVASIKLTDRKDKLGQSVSRVAVSMKEADGAVDAYTLDLNRADNSLKEVSSTTKTLNQENSSLDNGFKAVIGRMTQYFGAMEILQRSMQAFKAVMREIKEIDAERIELARVADPSINLDVVLERSVGMAKELGSSVQDVMQSVGEMARTFGEFNEAQLLAITQTATIATNVSDLNMGEATSAIVASIQAFNIEAEDSIRIINALNEVDNNYAISTHQLAEAINRAGATASTFGVEMEELAGDITAVGAVTQESGQAIGTALRTIYSRVTTLDASKEILAELGIAMHEMGSSGPEIRGVGDILGDLAGKWSDLSDEQRQNIGVTIAGRSRLTQFLALMNNYQMSIDATTSAYNSQGSAMREQEQYMQSYEYQTEVLGATVTDLSLTIEDKLVGDALYLLTTTAVDVLDTLNSLIERFGFLPTVLGGVASAMMMFNGNLGKAHKGVIDILTDLGVLSANLIKSDNAFVNFAGHGIAKVSGGISQLLGLTGSFGKLLSGGLVVGGVMLLASQLEKLVNKMAETKRANEEAQRSFETAMDTFNQNGQNIDGMINRYEELNNKLESNKDALSTDEMHEYNMLVTDLSTMMPSAVSHIDAQGQAHLRSASSLRDNADALKVMAESHSAYIQTLQENDVSTHFDGMGDVFERYNKSLEGMENRVDRSKQSFAEFAEEMRSANKTSVASIQQSDEALQKLYSETIKNYNEASTKHLSLEYELHGAYQETLLLMGDQTVAYMGSKGQLENVSTTAQALIRDYARMNEENIKDIHLIKDKEEQLAVYNNALAENKEFGDLVARTYDNMAEGLSGVDTGRAIEEFDRLVGALPDESLTQSMDVIEGYFDGMTTVVTQIMTDAEVDVDSLVQTLVTAGMDIDTATGFIIDLGVEMDNQAIRIAMAEEELTSYNDELTHTRDIALETVNPLSALFGYDSEAGKAMDSHIQTLQILKQQYGDTWHELDQGQASIGALAREFGVSESFIISNLGEMGQAIRALNTATVEWSTESQEYVWKFDDSVSESTRNLVQSMLKNGDSYTGFVNTYVEQNGVVKHSQSELEEYTKNLNKRFNEFSKGPQDRDNWNLLFNDMKDQLEHLYGTFMVVEDEVGNLKFQLADGTESEYFNNLTKQINDSDVEITIMKDTTDDLLKLMATDPSGNLQALAVIDEMAQSGTFAIQETKKALEGLMDASTSKEDRETFVELINNQIEFLEEDIIATKDETGKLVLAFQDPSVSSPWLTGLNETIEALGLKIKVTENETGEFILAIQTKEGETIFSQTAGDAQLAEDKIDKAGKKADEVTEKERNPIQLDIRDEEFNQVLDQSDERVGALTQGDNNVKLGMDDWDFNDKAGKAEERAKKLEEEKVTQLKLDIDEEGFNKTVEKVAELKIELMDMDKELEELERVLRATNEQMGGLMTNTENINNARNAIRALKDDVDEAIVKMGELYENFASGGIDTSGFESSASIIRGEVEGIEGSLVRMQKAVLLVNTALGGLGESFNLAPMATYSSGMSLHSGLIQSKMSELSSGVRANFLSINATLNSATGHLRNAVARTSDSLGEMTVLYRLTKEMIVRYIDDMGISITTDYAKTVATMLTITASLNSSLDIGFHEIGRVVRGRIQTMGQDMITGFQSATDSLVTTAESLPTRIGNGVNANIDNATGSMTRLAQSMVSRFKKELGIHSPSRVFEQLGGDVIDGLVNGLSGSDITNLGQSVFSDFSDGAISTIDQIKGYMSFAPVGAGSFGGAFSMTSGFGPRKSPGGIGSTSHKGVDYGAPMGTPIPSQSSGRVVASGWMGGLGNAVIIESSGGIRHVYGHNSKNYVSVGQTVGKGQAIGAVGSTGNSTGPHVHYEVRVNGVPVDPRKKLRGFAKGGFVDGEELAWVGEEGLEAIIPLTPHRKDRGLDLWAETGEILGMNASIIEMLIRSQKRSGVFGGVGGGFTGLDGEAGGGETATATSGTIAPDYSSIMRSLEPADQPMFSSMAKNNDMEALYRRDMHAINVGRFSGMLTKANTELTALMENTLKYRNALEEVNYQERKLRDATQAQLNATVKRQSQIEKELGKLRNTSKHTADQRKKYNELQQEFDRNSESILRMENEVRKLNISMDQRKVEIYTDYIGQLTKGFEDLTKAIDKTMSDLQFSLDYLTLTDGNNVGGQLKIQYDILRESIRLENTLMNSVNKLQAEYSSAVSKYGKNSEQALLAREELYKAESSYQSSVLNRVKLEQEIEKKREDVANEGIDTLKNYYKQTQTMTERAIDLEKKALEKHHKDKMSMYDDEIAKIESIYDTRIAEMDAQEAEDAYNETIADLNAQRAELMQQISRASRDTSLEGRKRLAELQAELGEVNAEMDKTQKERQDQLYRESIERQKNEQIQAIELQKERAEKEQEIQLESLDQQLLDAQNYAERMINDEAMWDRLRNEFVSGDGTGLASLTNEMMEQMSRFMSGDFGGVSMGYGDLSDEDKELFSEETLLEISNLMLKSSEAMERFVSTANENVQNIGNIAGGNYNAGAMTNWSGTTTKTESTTGPKIPPAPAPAPKPKQDNRHHVIKKGDTLWDLAQKYYGNPYQWTKIAQANANPDPRKLQIGRKLIIPFDTGGLRLVHVKDFELLEYPKAS